MSTANGVEAVAGLEPGQCGPGDVSGWLKQGKCVLVDVREPDERAREWIEGSMLVPLSRFDAGTAMGTARPGQAVVMQCRSGRRSAEAAAFARRAAPMGVEVLSMAGGIEAWKAAGLPVKTNTGAPRISIMRQVQLVVGTGALAGSALAWWVDPAFVAVPAFLGAGLMFAGATGTCALASVLGMMPWNRVGSGAGCAVEGPKGGCCS